MTAPLLYGQRRRISALASTMQVLQSVDETSPRQRVSPKALLGDWPTEATAKPEEGAWAEREVASLLRLASYGSLVVKFPVFKQKWKRGPCAETVCTKRRAKARKERKEEDIVVKI